MPRHVVSWIVLSRFVDDSELILLESQYPSLYSWRWFGFWISKSYAHESLVTSCDSEWASIDVQMEMKKSEM